MQIKLFMAFLDTPVAICSLQRGISHFIIIEIGVNTVFVFIEIFQALRDGQVGK